MWAAALIAAQAVAGPALPITHRPDAKSCPAVSATDDVVVCGRANESYRLTPLPGNEDKPALPSAELRVGNGKLAAVAEQATLAGGQQSQRLMLRFTLPIGKKPRANR